MNPEPHASSLSRHLTEAEFGEILAAPVKASASALTSAELHVLDCEQCAGELVALRESLSLFRNATTSYVCDQLRRMPPVILPARPAASLSLRSIALASAAALVLAAFVPLQLLHQERAQAADRAAKAATAASGFQRYATESNEALLDDVNQASSAGIPDAMQALANPANNDLSVQKSN